VRAEADALKTAWDAARQNSQQRRKGDAVDRARDAFAAKLHTFQEELAGVRILDPACGSGNFLYVALSKLLDLEKEVLTYGAANGLSHGYPRVGPQ
jgi:type II restriction/modification system DNA methylase subunit YeeA